MLNNSLEQVNIYLCFILTTIIQSKTHHAYFGYFVSKFLETYSLLHVRAILC